MMVFNVRQFGAMGDGNADDTQAIQLAIDSASQNPPGSGGSPPEDPMGKGGVVFFPAGRYKVSETLKVDHQAGIHLVGAGAVIQEFPDTGSWFGPRVTIFWDGESEQTLLEMKGAAGTVISDLAFFGAPPGESAIPGIRLIHYPPGDPQLGRTVVGNTHRNLLLANADEGIKVANIDGDPNCADMVFERIAMEKLNTGFFVPHTQGVNYRWNLLRARQCKTAMHFERGGLLDLDAAEIIECGGEGADDWAFRFGAGGKNVRTSRMTCVRIRDNTQKFLSIEGDHRVAVDSLTEAQDLADGDPTVRMTDGGALTFHGCSFQTLPLLEWAAPGSRRATVRFRDCWFDVPVPDGGNVNIGAIIDDPTAVRCFYSVERCDGEDNKPINDMESAWV